MKSVAKEIESGPGTWMLRKREKKFLRGFGNVVFGEKLKWDRNGKNVKRL